MVYPMKGILIHLVFSLSFFIFSWILFCKKNFSDISMYLNRTEETYYIFYSINYYDFFGKTFPLTSNWVNSLQSYVLSLPPPLWVPLPISLDFLLWVPTEEEGGAQLPPCSTSPSSSLFLLYSLFVIYLEKNIPRSNIRKMILYNQNAQFKTQVV